MDYNFSQIAYSEGVFELDRNAFKAGFNVGVGMNPVIKMDKDNDELVSLQLTVDYDCDGKKIMKYGGIAMFKVENLTESLDSIEFKMQIWSEAIMFFRGVVCEKLRGSEIERFLLPKIPNDKIADIPIQVS